jgi:hypothetical protein
MSTSNSGDSGEVLNLTDDEQILHHYAAMVKQDLEAYRTDPTDKSQKDWEGVFKHHLARLIPSNASINHSQICLVNLDELLCHHM